MEKEVALKMAHSQNKLIAKGYKPYGNSGLEIYKVFYSEMEGTIPVKIILDRSYSKPYAVSIQGKHDILFSTIKSATNFVEKYAKKYNWKEWSKF